MLCFVNLCCPFTLTDFFGQQIVCFLANFKVIFSLLSCNFYSFSMQWQSWSNLGKVFLHVCLYNNSEGNSDFYFMKKKTVTVFHGIEQLCFLGLPARRRLISNSKNRGRNRSIRQLMYKTKPLIIWNAWGMRLLIYSIWTNFYTLRKASPKIPDCRNDRKKRVL